MDAGGNESSQIFLYDLKSGKHKMITDGVSVNRGLIWSPDGEQLAFQSTERNGKSIDVWIASISGNKFDSLNINKKIVVKSPDGASWSPKAFDSFSKKLIVQQYVSSTKSLVYVKNLQTGSLQLIAGSANNESRNYGIDFNLSGDGVYIVTDRFGEFTKLVLIDIRSQQEKVVTKSLDWDIKSLFLSKDKTVGVLIANEDGYSQAYKLSTKDNALLKIDNLPRGQIYSVAFNELGQEFALSINTPVSPTDVYVMNLKTSNLTRWTHSEVGGLNRDSFVSPSLIHYPTFDDVDGQKRKIPAFVYKSKKKGKSAVVISIHGGPEGQSTANFNSTYQHWVEKLGLTVIVPNVRGSTGYGKTYVSLDNGFNRESSVKDIGALLDWIALQPDLDSERVAVYGGSYGGYMVLSSAMHYSERLKAAVDIVGISNFVTFLNNTKSYRRDLRRVEYGDERNPDMNKFLQQISPSNNVDKIKIPVFVVQGENDPRVPVTEATQIVKNLRDNGNLVWYMNALNEGHGYRKKENRDVFKQATVLFLQQYLLN
jgi:dipeptidyl aminopeptidase/acylaminoacyl peptidase